jgi:RimJ/RimL family protein N-acetyltransferase
VEQTRAGIEAARAALRFGLLGCDLGRIVSIVQAGNGASERITQKLGMRLERETVDPCGRAVRVYEISGAIYTREHAAGRFLAP